MANIDVTKITGFEEMTPEEKIEALLSYEVEEKIVKDEAELDKFKKNLAKANSEAAEYKRRLKEKMTEEELAKSKREEENAALMEELNTLRKEKTVSTYENQYLALGYDSALAKETAVAMADGDMTKVFAAQKKFMDSQTEKAKAEAMKNQPTITGGKTPSDRDLNGDSLIRKAMGL